MRSPLRAMLWELWRTSRLEMLGRIGFQCAVITWLSGFEKDFSTVQSDVLRAVIILMLTTGSLFSLTWLSALDNWQGGFSFRLGFSRPVSTTQLVLVPMLFTVVGAVICFLLPSLLFCLLTSKSLPLLAFGPGVACVAACLIATAWSPTTRFGKVIAITAVVIAVMSLLFVFHTRHHDPDPWLFAMGKQGYWSCPWYYYVGCALVSVAAVVVTVVGVERQRHGDQWRFAGGFVTGLTSLWRRRQAVSELASKPFRNRFAAQYWYEMRRVGRTVIPFGLLAPLFLFAFISFGAWMYSDWEAAPVIWLGAIVFCPFAYQLVGAQSALGLRAKQGTTYLPTFDATRSLRNDDLMAIKLLVIAVCSLIGWLCMAATAAVHSAMAGTLHVWASIGDAAGEAVGHVAAVWWIAALMCIVLQYISTTSILLAIGLWIHKHPVGFVVALAMFFAHFVLVTWDARRDWSLRDLWAAEGYVVALGIVVICVLALKKALTAGYLSKTYFGFACCLWAIYVASAVSFSIKAAPAITAQSSVPSPVLALGASMLVVPLASTAIAPLALASHRHA